jgi:hypothetical protein
MPTGVDSLQRLVKPPIPVLSVNRTHCAPNPEFEKLLQNIRVVGFDTGG